MSGLGIITGRARPSGAVKLGRRNVPRPAPAARAMPRGPGDPKIVFSCIFWSHGSLSTSRFTASSMIASASPSQLLAPQSAQIATGIFTRHETYPLRVHCRNASSCIVFTTIPRLQISQMPVSLLSRMAQNLFGQAGSCPDLRLPACKAVHIFRKNAAPVQA